MKSSPTTLIIQLILIIVCVGITYAWQPYQRRPEYGNDRHYGDSSGHCSYEDSIPISKVQSLTLDRDHLTTGMPGKPPIKQLQCLGGDCEELPVIVQCTNTGINDRGEIQWKCKGEVKSGYSLGKVDVSCVSCGIDPVTKEQLVLKGSCAAFVEVLRDNPNKRSPHRDSSRYRNTYNRHKGTYNTHRNTYDRNTQYNSNTESDSGIYVIIFIVVVIFIIIFVSKTNKNNTNRNQRYYHSGPSAPREEDLYMSPPHYETNSGPGFWSGFASGTAVGGAGGYALGKNQRHRDYDDRIEDRSAYRSTYRSDDSNEDDTPKKQSTGYGGTSFR